MLTFFSGEGQDFRQDEVENDSDNQCVWFAGRGATPVQARIFRPIRPNSDKRTVERGEKSQAKKEKKLIPYDQKLFDSIPGKSKKMFNARNVPREGMQNPPK